MSTLLTGFGPGNTTSEGPVSAYTLAMLGAALLLAGTLVAMRLRGAATVRKGGTGAAREEQARALAETSAATTGPMALSPPSSEVPVAGGWGAPLPVPPSDEALEPSPVTPSPFEPTPAPAWSEEDIVTAPGWPMPGELDLGWSGPAASAPGDEPAADLGMPRWQPPAAAAPPAVLGTPAPSPVLGTPAPSPVLGTPAPSPVRETPAPSLVLGTPGPSPVREAPAPWGDDHDADAPSWEPHPSGHALPPLEAEVGEAPASWDAPLGADAASEWPDGRPDAVVPAGWAAAPDETAPIAMPSWDGVPSAAQGSTAAEAAGDLDATGLAWLETAASAASPAPVAEHDTITWGEPPPAATPVAAHDGRFALGGSASAAGDQVLAHVRFREPLDVAPARWCRSPADDPRPGTLLLRVEGLDNCVADAVTVVDTPGFAPTTHGFTVRAAASAAGHFAAAGAYRIA